MARTIEKLKALQVTREDRPGRYPDGGGLYLQISPSGSKSWVFRYRSNGHLSTAGKPLSREMGIGSVHDVSLSEARQRAQEARRKLQDGIDPIQDRQTKRAATEAARSKAMTFAEAARKCIASKRAGWKSEKHASQWENTLLGDATLHLQKMAVSAITTADVMLVLQPLWTRIPETADRMRNRIEAVLGWAGAHGYRSGENCARWKKHLDQLLPRKSDVRPLKHHSALPFAEVPKFVERLRLQKGIGARALEWTILAAARTGETIAAKLDEIDRQQRVWTVPGARMKAKRRHRVPLTDRMIEILDELCDLHAAQGEFIFPSPNRDGPISSVTMLALLERMGFGHVTTHGFRSSFRDWASELTAFDEDVIEFSLSHVEGSKAKAAYKRSDLLEKRRPLMTAWASFVEDGAPQSAVVVNLTSRTG
jgi:integrase